MLEHKITGLPVVSEGKVVGMLSQGDVFRVLTSITGIYRGGTLFSFLLDDRPGSIKEVADVVRKHGGRMVSILTSYDMVEEGKRRVAIRIADMPQDKVEGLRQELDKGFDLQHVAHDELSDV
jgi:acetoin utilization protein AcuB